MWYTCALTHNCVKGRFTMAVTGKTGADAWYKTVKKQADIYRKFGPKLTAVINTMLAANLLTPTEAAALVAGFNATPEILSAIAKVAEYSGLWG